MKIKVSGKGVVNLSNRDFKGAGGEGSVYIKGGTAYKIYSDPKRVIETGKVQELARISDPRVIRPLDLIENDAGTVIGYTMAAVPESFVLCELFPKAFRDRHGIKPDYVTELVLNLRQGVETVHQAQVLIVDLNEMNFLIDKKRPLIYFIDVDSYQTPHFRATALMESVRDRQSKGFSEGTDWFAFACVSFQMFTSIHPFKGKHPSLKTMDERMMANISVLNKDVRVPGACLPFDVIPPSYRTWFEAVLERGERLAPPTKADGGAYAVKLVTLGSAGVLAVAVIHKFGEDVIDALGDLALLPSGVYRSDGNRLSSVQSETCRLAWSGSVNGAFVACVRDGVLTLFDATTGEVATGTMSAESIAVSEGKLYAKFDENVYSVDVMRAGKNLILTQKAAVNVLPQASRLYDGAVVQDLLGATYVHLLGAQAPRQVRLKELDGRRVISARHERHVFVAVAERGGTYDRFVFRVNPETASYDVRVSADVGPTAVNFTVLDSGVALLMTENDELEFFSSKPGRPEVKTVSDPAVNSSCHLFSHGSKAMFYRANELAHFRMK